MSSCRLFHQGNDPKWASPGTALCHPGLPEQLKCHLLARAVSLGVGYHSPLVLGRDYLSSCTRKLLFRFRRDAAALGGSGGKGCEELESPRAGGFQSVRLGLGYRGFSQKWSGGLYKITICASASHSPAQINVCWHQGGGRCF